MSEQEAQYCPNCGFVTDWDEWDILGADDGNAFCPVCNSEVPSEASDLPLLVTPFSDAKNAWLSGERMTDDQAAEYLGEAT